METTGQRIERLVLTVWVGALLGVGYIAVPTLFRILEDRALAGSLAGEMFSLVAVVGLVCGACLLAYVFFRGNAAPWRHWRFWALVLMIVLTLIGHFVLQPMIAEVKAQGLVDGSEAKQTFGRLHAAASVLYLATTALGVILVLAGRRQNRTFSN